MTRAGCRSTIHGRHAGISVTIIRYGTRGFLPTSIVHTGRLKYTLSEENKKVSKSQQTNHDRNTFGGVNGWPPSSSVGLLEPRRPILIFPNSRPIPSRLRQPHNKLSASCFSSSLRVQRVQCKSNSVSYFRSRCPPRPRRTNKDETQRVENAESPLLRRR
jgi:hypothetical protein